MMDAVRQWGFSLCAAAVACSLAQLLAPKTGASKIFRLTVSTFFLCCIFSPLLLRLPSFELSLSEEEGKRQSSQIAQQLEESLGRAYYEPAAPEAEKELRGLLEKLGVQANKIVININTKGEDSIGIYGAELVLDESYRGQEERILASIKRELGYEVSIRYEKRDGADRGE